VQFEGLLIREEIYRDHRAGLRKFVPVLLPGAEQADIPTLLLPYSGTHYSVAELTNAGVRHVLELLRQPPEDDQHERAGGAPGDTTGQDESHMALRLIVSGGMPGAADEAVRALLSAGAGGTATFGTDTRTDGAIVTGSPAQVISGFTRAVRAIHRRTGGQPGNGAAPLRAELGAHLAPRPDEALAVAISLASGEAARRMHAVPAAHLVLVVSPAFHRELLGAARSRPAAMFYRECPGAGVNGDSCWIAVPGRSQAPALPPAAPPDLEPAPEPEPVERRAVAQVFRNNGTFEGNVQQIAGDATVNVGSIVQNFGGRR
jgi:hypothetical protein